MSPRSNRAVLLSCSRYLSLCFEPPSFFEAAVIPHETVIFSKFEQFRRPTHGIPPFSISHLGNYCLRRAESFTQSSSSYSCGNALKPLVEIPVTTKTSYLSLKLRFESQTLTTFGCFPRHTSMPFLLQSFCINQVLIRKGQIFDEKH